jgi:hypothetical protein
MVSTSELTVVVPTDTVDLVCFLLLFFSSSVWVATMEAATRKADTFQLSVAYDATRRPWTAPYATWRSLVVTPHRRVGDVLVDGRRRCFLYIRSVADLVTAPILVAQWCRAPVDALAVLKTQDIATQLDLRQKK